MSDIPLPFSVFDYVKRTKIFDYLNTHPEGVISDSNPDYGWKLTIDIQDHNGDRIKSYMFSPLSQSRLPNRVILGNESEVRDLTLGDLDELIRSMDKCSLEEDAKFIEYEPNERENPNEPIGTLIDERGIHHPVYETKREDGFRHPFTIYTELRIVLKKPSPGAAAAAPGARKSRRKRRKHTKKRTKRRATRNHKKRRVKRKVKRTSKKSVR